MKKAAIISLLTICFIPAISRSQTPNFSIDRLQNMLFGVSTLKGVQEVYPQVQIEVLEPVATQLNSTSKIGTLIRNDIQDQVVQALQKADIKIAKNSDMSSEKAPLSLNITIFIKIAVTDPPIYDTFIYTEALQSIRLGRDNSIRSFSRTWPMQPMSLVTRNMFELNSSKLEDTVKEEVNKQVGAFISDFHAANPESVPRSAEGVDIKALRETLFTMESGLDFQQMVRNENSPQMQAIKQLDMAGSEEAINVLFDCLTDDKMNIILKQNALTALGRIGTEPAIAAIKKFERWSQRRYTDPYPFYMSTQPSIIDHLISGDLKPLAQAKDKDNKTWGIVWLKKYRQEDIYLTSQIKDDNWSEPVLVNLPDTPATLDYHNTKWNLQIEGDSFKITYNDKTYESKISDELKDTDKDGFPDIVEARLLTDPKKSDSDGDSIPDGKDSNPLTPKHNETNDITEIYQAVFSVMFATSNSRNAIFVVDRGDFAKQEYYGYAGPVMRIAKHIEGIVNLTSIDIKYQSKDEATVDISDHVASESASGHDVKLKKLHGKWVVVSFEMTWIS
ncbi:MAG: HEAT repeat domain-containing protein [Sedimentisphaerales bacterium]|nr:HEAT repeat domain-containing protein [Sedimentisphaerales bacterium]